MCKIGEKMELTDQQWDILERHFPQKELYQQSKGRPRIDPREILEGILWVLKTGSAWKTLPKRYPSYQTCHRRYQEWVKNGLLETLLKELIEDLESRGGVRLDDTFIDGSFSEARKAALELVKLSEGNGAESWQLRTAMLFLSGYPLEVFHRVKSSPRKEPANSMTLESSESVTEINSCDDPEFTEKTVRENGREVWNVWRRASNNCAGLNMECESAKSTFSPFKRRRHADPRRCSRTHCFVVRK